TISNTASHQHQQEQEMLSGFAIPNPPISTQQSSVIAADKDSIDSNHLQSSNQNNSQIDSPRTLWMGDLDPWLDENGIADLWWTILNKKVSVKIIKPRISKPDMDYLGLSHSGYCFVEFESFDDAQQALSLNGKLLPDIAMPSQQQFPKNPDNQKKYFRLNWASGATLTAPIIQTPEYSLFVGDLSASTTEAHLLAFFQKKFPTSIKTVRVMTDPVSGKSRCFGFVRFTDELERQKALIEMNGAWFGGRPLRVALATPRNNSNQNNSLQNHSQFQNQNHHSHHPNGHFRNHTPNSLTPGNPSQGIFSPNNRNNPNFYNDPNQSDLMFLPSHSAHPPPPSALANSPYGTLQGNSQGQPFTDPKNTTVFVGGLSSEVSEQTLFTLFKPFGLIQQVKIPPGKNCGFIKYDTREEAEEAIGAMQGFIIGGNRIRLSWGRVSMNNKKYQQQQQQVAQAAQIQAAAALSMGMDPASAIAAAAAAAAGGYP
ncbi:RNA-binding domain-containing protein, partial [Hyphopichia burtonii NRRL Y-1933]